MSEDSKKIDVFDPRECPYLKLKLTQLTVSGQGLNKTEEWEYDPELNVFTISSGATNVRFGANKARKTTRPAEEWEGLLSSRLGHKWVIIATEKAVVKEIVHNTGFKQIVNSAVRDLVSILNETANNFFEQSFSVKVEDIPKEDLKKARDILDNLTTSDYTVAAFNQKLLELWTIIPRPMNRMKKFIAHSPKDYEKIITRETETLDFLEDQIRLAESTAQIDDQKDILEANNLELEPATEEEIKYVKSLMTDVAGRATRIFKAKSIKQEAIFDKFCEENNCCEEDGTIKHLFHGSGVENWWSILLNGLYLDPAKVKADVTICGKAFGYGIYFAPYAGKSMGYAGGGWRHNDRDKNYLAIFKVATGKPYYIYSEGGQRPSHWSDFHEDHPDRLCCWAGAQQDCSENSTLWRLNYDEVIVYQQEQCTIEYLIEFC